MAKVQVQSVLNDVLLGGGLYLAKPYSAKSESAVQESGKPYFAQPGNC